MELVTPELATLGALDRCCFSDPYPASIWQSYLEKPERYPIFLFRVDSEQVGYACFSVLTPEAELLRVGVMPDKRGRGFAEAGLRLAQQRLAQQGVERIMLEVRESNDAARKLYNQLGYVNDGRRPNYYPAESDRAAEDALLFSWYRG